MQGMGRVSSSRAQTKPDRLRSLDAFIAERLQELFDVLRRGSSVPVCGQELIELVESDKTVRAAWLDGFLDDIPWSLVSLRLTCPYLGGSKTRARFDAVERIKNTLASV
jgi:hypothetical protein